MVAYLFRLFTIAAVTGSVLAGAAGVASAKSTPTIRERSLPGVGKVLVTPKGRTLYYYTPDSKTKSNCTGGCASLWPPLLLPKHAEAPVKPAGLKGTLSSIKRGSRRQVSYDGHPLYTYAQDKKPGQDTGQGVGGVWYVMKAK